VYRIGFYIIDGLDNMYIELLACERILQELNVCSVNYAGELICATR
jgi:hypothetical protein